MNPDSIFIIVLIEMCYTLIVRMGIPQGMASSLEGSPSAVARLQHIWNNWWELLSFL